MSACRVIFCFCMVFFFPVHLNWTVTLVSVAAQAPAPGDAGNSRGQAAGKMLSGTCLGWGAIESMEEGGMGV